MIVDRKQQHWFVEQGVDGVGTGFSLQNKELLHSERSEWQLIEVYQTETFGKLFVFDGLVMLTERDNFIYHEMLAHPALLLHPAPKTVLIIGGGDCGTLLEVSKHPDVEQITQVEIDERVTRVAETYFPKLCTANNDPRVKLLFEDGVAYMKSAKPASIDVILIDSTDPIDFAEGLFNQPFYEDCIKALKPGGLLAQQGESPFIHQRIIGNMQQKMKNAGMKNLSMLHYHQPCYPSGWWSFTLASIDNDLMTLRPADLRENGLNTLYYNEDVFHASRALPNFMKRGINI